MPSARTQRELGRGERVLPGLWRLRLPLPWPGVPHGNAWAIAAGPGIVLVDTGYHEPGSLAQLERAMNQVNLRLEHVRLLVCTHAHSDHWGQAAPIVERAGCELWMHPNHEHATRNAGDPEATLARRLEIGRQSGVPATVLERYAERFPKNMPSGIAKVIEPDRPLVDGVEIETDLGTWRTYETPGHAPSHVCLFQPERRILISGDHVLGRISLYYDYGWTPDPVDEILASSDEPVFSFEFFPPKTDDGERNLRTALEALQPLEPDFASVTYGAGGSTRERTVEITRWIKGDLGIEAMAHLSCVGATREDLQRIVGTISAAGIEHILALRGDPPRGETARRPR